MDWHYADELNEAVHSYYAKYACLPPQFEKARLLHLQVLEDIRKLSTDSPMFTHRLEQIVDDGVGEYVKDGFEFRVHFIMVCIVIVDFDDRNKSVTERLPYRNIVQI